jgi:hypothetical protein
MVATGNSFCREQCHGDKLALLVFDPGLEERFCPLAQQNSGGPNTRQPPLFSILFLGTTLGCEVQPGGLSLALWGALRVPCGTPGCSALTGVTMAWDGLRLL